MPKTIPRRAELIAIGGVLVIVAHVLFAQLTIVLAIVFHAVTKISRWRPHWLALPAAVGLLWALAIGPATAVTGLLAGPRKIVTYLSGVGGAPARALHLGAAYAGLTGWLPRQLPLALVTGAAEAAVAAWLSWLHTDEWRLAPVRPGVMAAFRRRYLTRVIQRGGVVTRDGACLGVQARTGRRAALSWQEAARGVLCAGAPGSGTTTTAFQLVHAAIRRRKPVIVVDLTGSRQVAEWLAIICGAARAPLHSFSAAGAGCYEPLREGSPARRTALVIGMIDWTGAADQHRRSCAAYLNDLFAVTDAAPGDPTRPVLDEVLHLLDPAALRARARQIPRFHPHREALTKRVEVSASLFEADPQPVVALASQLGELWASPIGRWLAPRADAAVATARVDLGRAIRQRGVVLFSLGDSAHSRPATMVASLVAQDVIAICADLRGIGVPGDAVLWFGECGGIPTGVLAELVSRGAAADVAAVLTTTSAVVADGLADYVNAVVIHRMTDPLMAERFAWVSGERLVPSEAGASAMPGFAKSGATPGFGAAAAAEFRSADGVAFVRKPRVSPEILFGLGKGEFVLAVKSPRPKLVPLGKTVPARLHTAGRRAIHRAAAHARRPPMPGAAVQVAAHPRQPLSIHGDQAGTDAGPYRGPLGDGPPEPAPDWRAAGHLGREGVPADARRSPGSTHGTHRLAPIQPVPYSPQQPNLPRAAPAESPDWPSWPT